MSLDTQQPTPQPESNAIILEFPLSTNLPLPTQRIVHKSKQLQLERIMTGDSNDSYIVDRSSSNSHSSSQHIQSTIGFDTHNMMQQHRSHSTHTQHSNSNNINVLSPTKSNIFRTSSISKQQQCSTPIQSTPPLTDITTKLQSNIFTPQHNSYNNDNNNNNNNKENNTIHNIQTISPIYNNNKKRKKSTSPLKPTTKRTMSQSISNEPSIDSIDHNVNSNTNNKYKPQSNTLLNFLGISSNNKLQRNNSTTHPTDPIIHEHSIESIHHETNSPQTNKSNNKQQHNTNNKQKSKQQQVILVYSNNYICLIILHNTLQHYQIHYMNMLNDCIQQYQLI